MSLIAKQRTIAKTTTIHGIGVHSGNNVSVTLHAAAANTGIIFRRIDTTRAIKIAANVENVCSTQFSTNLGQDGVQIKTVEHLLAALAGLEIDNVFIDITSDELPIVDGSAIEFIKAIQANGVQELAADKKYIKIKRSIEVSNENGGYAKLLPANNFTLELEIDYTHPLFDKNNQHMSFVFNSQNFIEEIAAARTFGFLRDYEFMRKNKLAQGASLANTVVFDEESVVNEEGMRFDNEFTRHKILDAVGDLYLLNKPIMGKFIGFKSGHGLNNSLLRELLSDKDNFEII